MVRFMCSALQSTSFCLLSVLVSWTWWVDPIDLLLFHMLAFASSLAHGLVLKSSSALSALRCLLYLLLISVSFLLCMYQENPVAVFLQTANENHCLSWRMRPVG